MTSFESRTGLMGSTKPGQIVTADNVEGLPPGSVVRLDAGGRLIHLHGGLWLYCKDFDGMCGTWKYDRVHAMLHKLPGVLCHIP